MSFQNCVAPDIESNHVVELGFQSHQFVFVLFSVEVTWLNWLFKEVFSVWLIVRVKQNSVEVLVQLTGLVFHQKLNSVHELAILIAAFALPFLRSIQVLARERLFAFGVKSLHHLPGVLWVNSERVESDSEHVLFPLLQWYVVIIEKQIIQFKKRKLRVFWVRNFCVKDRRHNNLIGIFQHHFISVSFVQNLGFHFLDDRILIGEPQNIG